MFLQVAATNHDPAVIAYYYLRCVKQIQRCPRLVQTDCGTENVVVAAIREFFALMLLVLLMVPTAIDTEVHRPTNASKHGGLITENKTAAGGLIPPSPQT